MLRNLASIIGHALILVLSATALVWAADFGTAEEAKTMLEKAVAAVRRWSATLVSPEGHPAPTRRHVSLSEKSF